MKQELKKTNDIQPMLFNENQEDSGSIPGYKRITAAEMNYEACVRLVCDVLNIAHDDYIKALKVISACMKKSSLTMNERTLFINALKTKAQCEEFYKSERFIKFSMGLSIPGTELIRIFKEEAGFKDCD